ncbi:hypothetical protein LPJ56_001413, partial [Coemansia sp. RSA 2599]
TRTVFTVANVGVVNEASGTHAGSSSSRFGSLASVPNARGEEEFADDSSQDLRKPVVEASSFDTAVIPVLSVDRPYFHVDLDEALKATEIELGLK